METPKIKILRIFKDKLEVFLNDLLNLFPTDEKLIMASITIRDYPNFEGLMQNFIKYLFPLKDRVKNRDENYLLSNEPNIYKIINESLGSEETVEDFKNRWRTNKISKDNKEAVWRWADLFIILGEKYLKSKEKENNV